VFGSTTDWFLSESHVGHNHYPRKALFEAILRSVEEDLDARADRAD